MDTIEAIMTRRSIRKYTRDLISDEIIHKLLQAAMNAPSCANGQTWRFIVINDHHTLNEIPKFHSYSAMLKEAPLAIVVCGDLSEDGGRNMWEQDCSAATQNILLVAHALGLGAVWLGVYPVEQRVVGLRRLLYLPTEITPLSIISIGYPAEQKPYEDRYDNTKVHYNRW